MLRLSAYVVATRQIKLASHNAGGRIVAAGEHGVIIHDHVASFPNLRWQVKWDLGGSCLCSENEVAHCNAPSARPLAEAQLENSNAAAPSSSPLKVPTEGNQ